MFLKHNEPQVRTLQTPQLISCKGLQRSLSMIYIFFIQCQHACFVGSAGAFDCSVLSTYLQSFFIPLRNAACFFSISKLMNAQSKSPAVSPVLYPPGSKQNIVSVLFTCVLVYISSISERYQGTAVHIPCVFSTILSLLCHAPFTLK